MFVKDMESGVRKVDFYNYVTGHLGRIGYRDVWHILKIAYPHVDRVRRGRKYMYWGIRHVDDKLEHMTSASLNEGDGALCGNTNVNEKDGGDDEKDLDDSGGEGCGDKADNNNTINNGSNCNGSNGNYGKDLNNSNNNNNYSNIDVINNNRSRNDNNNNSVNDDNNNNLNDNSSNNRIQPDTTTTKNSSNSVEVDANSTHSESDAVSNSTAKDDSVNDSSTKNDSTTNTTSSSSNGEKNGALSTTSPVPVVVKREHLSDNEDEETKLQDFLVMEFKEKAVFESFEGFYTHLFSKKVEELVFFSPQFLTFGLHNVWGCLFEF